MGGVCLQNNFINLNRMGRLVIELALKDLKLKYLGSFLGVFWAFFHPIIIIFVYWFVFQIGFKSLPVDNFPFILWLIAGIVPWFFFSESIANSTMSIIENSFLVKKLVFPVSVLPLIKIVSAMFVHLFFIVVLIVIFAIYGYYPNQYTFQLFYYTFSNIIFVIGLSWITSSLNVFLKDVGQFVGMFLQLFFWITPIFWNLNIAPEKYHFLFKLNPIYYIVVGYRNSLIDYEWFWEHPFLTIYFWGVTLVIFVFGYALFNRLRIHFPDVL
ncbi:ABC transporter permease [Bacillus sp. P2(2020)]|uniref:Transport permease protein n=1 Tax=Calidifontibacillus erzurumensis TaxID=2741433 RepID=A0A8J8K8L8_9BACI|nr:ABC transporter permease [Calidifontibacillus erzurumensis]